LRSASSGLQAAIRDLPANGRPISGRVIETAKIAKYQNPVSCAHLKQQKLPLPEFIEVHRIENYISSIQKN